MTRTQIEAHRTTQVTNEALYVYEHGLRQRSRGRNYSLSYGEISNPRKAFEKARKDLREYHPSETMSAHENIDRMIYICMLISETVTGIVNEVNVVADVYDFNNALNLKFRRRLLHASYNVRLRGLEAKRKYEAGVARLRDKLSALTAELEILDFSDIEAVMYWLHEYFIVNQCMQNETRADHVYVKFENAGYVMNEECGDPKIIFDKVLFARWIIGQALVCLYQDRKIYSVLDQFFYLWKSRFEVSDPRLKSTK